MAKPLDSAGRRKLAALNITLPPIPVAGAGSLPKQTELSEMRYKVAKNVQAPSELERKEKLAVEIWIRQQERIGLDVLTDGEMQRGDMVQFFAKKLDGFVDGGTVRVIGNRFYRRPVIRGKVAYRGPLIVETWRSTQRMSHRPVKAILTGPYTLLDWSFNEHYATRAEAYRDIVAALRREVTALGDAGAKILQIDEPALGGRPDEMEMAAAGLSDLLKGLRAYLILHVPYVDPAVVWPVAAKLPVDNIHIDLANHRLATLPFLKKNASEKDLTLGLVDAQFGPTETPAALRARLKASLGAVPAARLWLSSDTGLKTRPADEAIAKLQTLVGVAARARSAYR